jgi:hypothetical protein
MIGIGSSMTADGTTLESSAPQQVRQLSRGTTDGELNAVDLPGLTRTKRLEFLGQLN